MDIETIRRISLARHLFELASGSLRSKNDLQLFSAVNLAQDAVETFLLALADHLHVAIDSNTKFDKYFTLIDDKVAPQQLPFKAKLLRLNRVRVDSKHHGIQPDRGECERLLGSAREFLEEASQQFLGGRFSTISAVDLLEDGECKTLLASAKEALEMQDYESCLLQCRQALYLEVERHYDISEYKDGEPKGLLAGVTSAPFYALSKDYIAKNVRDPTDYIVLDHSAVDRDLLITGVDPTDFWNVWRLTPEVYRDKGGKWYVKRNFAKLDQDVIAENAEYVFSAAVDVALARHSSRLAVRVGQMSRFYVVLARPNVPVYSKADRSSPIAATVPLDIARLDTDYTVPGLVDDGPYWHVHHFETGKFFDGYVHNDDVQSES